MSIIYDALKKVEKTADKDAPKPKDTSKAKPIIIFILVIILGFFAGNMLISSLTRSKFKPTVSPVLPMQIEKPVLPPAPAEPVRSSEPTLVLNGILFEQDKGYALINNQVLKVGDTIKEAKVQEISMEKVVLEFEGRKITLVNPSR